MMDSTIALKDYQITEQLYAGSKTLVYRALRGSDQKAVILKLLRDEMPTFNELVQFRNQYTITKSLDLPGIIQIYSLERCGNGYVLVMEDFGGIPLSKFAQGQPLDVPMFLAIALQLCDILHYLYQHRVIHKDIKPANILIHPETGQVKLIDFSIASLLPKETQEIENPSALEGTLAYLSPEQTGRMNRGIDYRSDFYSLGITFFQLLTGQLPFPSDDPMDLIHHHIAKQPPEAHSLNLEIPPILGEIVRKLMAKNAEDRYQSALGLKFDLETCLSHVKEKGNYAWFTLGQRDLSDRFLIPEKLYGREPEVTDLLCAFDRASAGKTELLLVAGSSGIGKTAVVNEVHKPILRQRGYFIKGKYDQFQRNIPFSAFVQAFRSLIEQLLSESDSQLAVWKTRILEAVGENGQVIIDVIPELEQLIGQQSAALALSGSAEQNRFNLLFQKFVQVFTHKEHPLVIFLDDVQWADGASLNLLQLLMNDAGYLLVLGAYRDNEVSPAHPLMLTVNEIAKLDVTVNTITLQPLNQADIDQVVSDTLNCTLSIAQPLAKLVHQKTNGNPFFTTQFLKALHQDGRITFDHNAGHWQCDITQVQALALTNDVVEFMAAQLQKLPEKTQNALKLAACIGVQFDLQTLAIVAETSQNTTAADLWLALQEGLIVPTSDVYKFFDNGNGNGNKTAIADHRAAVFPQSAAYKFLHDRVQQAAYSLIPANQKQETHLKIGQLLLSHISTTEQEEKLFEIVNQLNIGKSLITDLPRRIELAQLNLRAGQKARSSTAYAAAFEYSISGIALLPENCWQTHYKLTLSLHEAATEAAYLNGNLRLMSQFEADILEHARTLLDTIKLHELKIQAAQAQHNFLEAVQIALTILARLGIHFPQQPNEADIAQACEVTQSVLAGRQVLDLLDLPQMTQPDQLAAIRILAGVSSSAYVIAPMLLPFIILEQVNLSVQYGNTAYSANGYAYYGLMLCGVMGDIDRGYQFGQLAMQLIEQLNAKELKARAYVGVHCSVWHWKEPLRNTLPFLQDGYQSGLETGDLESATICAFVYVMHKWFVGKELSNLSQESAAFRTQLTQLNQEGLLNHLTIFQQAILNLMSDSAEAWQLTGSAFNQEQALPAIQAAGDQTALCYFYISQLILCYGFGKFELAIEAAEAIERHLGGATGLFLVTLFHTYDSLARLAMYAQGSEAERQGSLQRVAVNQEKIRIWAAYAPANQQHKFDLVEAEQHRVLGNKIKAIDCYDRAIAGAKENQYCQEEALANELAAKFYLEWGKEKVAQVYMQEAYYGYARWGAKAKIADLETRYPQLLAAILSKPKLPTFQNESLNASLMMLTSTHATIEDSGSSSSLSQAIDLAAVLKAAQTLYSEIYLDRLLASLMEVVVEIAGANKAALVLKQTRGLEVVVKYFDGAVQNLQPIPIDQSRHLPIALIRYIERTQEAVIAGTSTTFLLATDLYLAQFQPPSFLGTPILNRGKLIGILYLENSVTKGAFTRDRIELLTLLCSQAAISLENAHLYQETQIALQTLQQKEAQYRSIFEAVSDGLAITDLETGRLMAANPAYCKLHGYAYDELMKLDPVDVIRPELHDKFIAFLKQVQAGNEFICEANCLRENGVPFKAEMRSTPFSYNGRPCGLTVIRNVTERKQMERAIQDKNQSLELALSELQQAQMQMIQSEKMSALGNLVAGVAHEINNPVGFLSGNIQPALEYINDLFELLDLYQKKYPNPDSVIQHEMEAIDLEFLREDLPKLIGSMQEGIDRIKNISISLRTFSRADSDRPVACNIHDGLDSTILILKHRLKADEVHPAIEVTKHYGNLPKIECFAGQLNQVFMNILSNAIDALEEADQAQSLEAVQTHPSRIILTTELTDDQQSAIIRIRDNGLGMTEEVRRKIFDHLFTTKAVGKGTGLGLAIARQIVEEKHGGVIEVNSVLGQGTEFIITLPVKGSDCKKIGSAISHLH